MSRYAEVLNNKVLRVIEFNDDVPVEDIAEVLMNVSSNPWIKVDNQVRHVSKEDEFHPDLGVFTNKKPFNGWVIDKQRGIWMPPIPKPIAIPVGYVVYWSQELGKWVREKL